MRRATSVFANPFLLWTNLGWKTGAMMMEAAQVIGHRTGRMTFALAAPAAGDRREFSLMQQEKVEAAVESAQAVGLRLVALNQQLAALAFRQMLTGTAGMLTLAASRTPARSVANQATLVRDAMTRSSVTGAKLAGSAGQLAKVALKPVHTRVSANVTRLRKR